MTAKELELMLDERIVNAHYAGMSAVEITRTIRKRTVQHVNSRLRRAGRIEPVSATVSRRFFDMHDCLTTSLKYRGISFGQWCMEWEFDPDEASLALKKTPDPKRPTVFHKAMQRDFPRAFSQLFGWPMQMAKPYDTLYNLKYKTYDTQHSIAVAWDAEQRRYMAKVVELPKIVAFGINWAEALDNLTVMYRIHEGIRRLDEAIEMAGKARIPYLHKGDSNSLITSGNNCKLMA